MLHSIAGERQFGSPKPLAGSYDWGVETPEPDEPSALPDIASSRRAPIPIEDVQEFGQQAPPSTPSAMARWLAFAAILIGGACGGLIGYGFVDLQCDDGCSTSAALGGLVGAVIGAGGVAIVAVLGLRAVGEWNTLMDREEQVTRGRRS